MSQQSIAHLLLILSAAVPVLTAYMAAKNYFRFEQRSARQYLAVFASLIFLLGPILLQNQILEAMNFPTAHEFLRRLTAILFNTPLRLLSSCGS